MNNPWHITAVYKFTPIKEGEVETHQQELHKVGEELGIIGLLLVATEGINGTIAAASQDTLDQYKQFLESRYGNLTFKDSIAKEKPFVRWFVKIRKEIVHIGDETIVPESENNNHITPDEWNKMMEDDDVVIIDTRNTYETEIGMFEGAIDPRMEKFTEWREYVEECGIPKDKKVMMYCTGGIRCEKASIEMQKQGYKHVYQLKGGILQYLKEHPNEKFDGECFVFDHRAAVNQELNPSEQYKLCPHCGDPGNLEINCSRCKREAIICQRCAKVTGRSSCSKNCAYHIQQGHRVRTTA